MKFSKYWGDGRVDCMLFTAVISCSLLLNPWFATAFIMMVPALLKKLASGLQPRVWIVCQMEGQVIEPVVQIPVATVKHLNTRISESKLDSVVDGGDQYPGGIMQRCMA